MKKNIFYLAVACCNIILCLYGCKKAEDIKTSTIKPEKNIVDYTLDKDGSTKLRIKTVTLSKDTVYIIEQTFERQAGEQLIIEEGTLIKSNSTGNNNLGIIIKPGGFITANGTAKEPIVFTLNQRASSQTKNWDGITIKGKSFNNDNGTTGDASDFSGVLNFVRIEFGALSLEGVGNKTLVENVMVSYAKTDVPAVGIYGGTFNTRNIIVYASKGPADFYISNGYTGTMQNIIACRHPFFGKPANYPFNFLAGIFIQNNTNNPSAKPITNPVISNITVLGPNGQNGSPAEYADTSIIAGALVTVNSGRFQMRNAVFMGYPAAGWYLNDSIIGTNLLDSISRLRYCIIHSNTTARAAYLKPGTVSNYTSSDFTNFVLRPLFNNKIFNSTGSFMLQDIAQYDLGPNLMPASGSPLLSGANFNEPAYSNNAYINKNIQYIGALGTDNWLQGWVNFTPLKTNYNFGE